MANFGARLAYPTPDWVAYRRPSADVFAPPAPVETAMRTSKETVYRPSRRTKRTAFTTALRRFLHAWARSHIYNSFV